MKKKMLEGNDNMLVSGLSTYFTFCSPFWAFSSVGACNENSLRDAPRKKKKKKKELRRKEDSSFHVL